MNISDLPAVALVALVASLPFVVAPAPRVVNLPPVCDPGPDVVVASQGPTTIVQLDGSGSYDPDGDPISFHWTSTCPGATFSHPDEAQTALTIDTSAGVPFQCLARLEVSDGELPSLCEAEIEIVAAGPDLDIKPGSCPNPFNTNTQNNGKISIALTGRQGFHVGMIVVSSLELRRADGVGGFAKAISAKYTDVARPFDEETDCDCQEAQADGILDLRLKFRRKDLTNNLLLQALPNKSFVELELRGTLIDGTAFQAFDCIRVQHPGGGN